LPDHGRTGKGQPFPSPYFSEGRLAEEDKVREKLREAIRTAFDKWGARNFDVIVNPDTKKNSPEALEGIYQEDIFMTKRVCVLGLFRHVTKQVMASEDFQRQRRTVTLAILRSIMHPSGVLPGELETHSKDDKLYTRRNVQHILRDRYPETFFETGTKPKGSGNVRPYSAVFSPYGVLPLERPITVKKVQLADWRIMARNKKLVEWITLNSQAQTVFPELLESLESFKSLCAELLRELPDDPESSAMGKIMREELDGLSESFVMLHNHVLSIVSIEWFRSRQGPAKRALLDGLLPLKYTKEDAAAAASLLLRIKGSADEATEIVSVGAQALMECGERKTAEVLYSECLKFETLGPRMKGITHENLAVIHRKEGNPKLMIQEMKLAVASYKEEGERYRVAVALKNLGEAEWMLGYAKLAEYYFDQAEELGEGMKAPDKANVYANLAAAAMRLKQDRLEIKYTKKFLECAPDTWSDKILNASERLGVLSRRQM
jgi:tetratricopeptide (TPR) repeat protein